jgi:hypothetical protein
MARLKNTGAETTTLAAGATSQYFCCPSSGFTLLFGGAFETSTATLKVCATPGGTYTTLTCDDVAGTPTDQAFTVTHVTASTKSYPRYFHLPGLFFKITTNSTGVAPAITVDVTCDGPLTLGP